MCFRDEPLENLVIAGLELFSENCSNNYRKKTQGSQYLYEELYERAVIERQHKNIPYLYDVSIYNLRNKLELVQGDIKQSKYPLNPNLKDKLFEIIKKGRDNEVKKRLVLPDTYSYTKEIETKDLEAKTVYIFENLHVLQEFSLGLKNTTNFMRRAEIGFKIIQLVCGTDRSKKIEIAHELKYETEPKNYNQYFTQTLEHINEYFKIIQFNNRTKLRDLVWYLNSSIRHKFSGRIYDTNLDYLPQFLSHEVYVMLNDYLNPNNENEPTPSTTTEPPTSGNRKPYKPHKYEPCTVISSINAKITYLIGIGELDKIIEQYKVDDKLPKLVDVLTALKELKFKDKGNKEVKVFNASIFNEKPSDNKVITQYIRNYLHYKKTGLIKGNWPINSNSIHKVQTKLKNSEFKEIATLFNANLPQ